jgi:hypothetical protein
MSIDAEEPNTPVVDGNAPVVEDTVTAPVAPERWILVILIAAPSLIRIVGLRE